MYEYAMMVWNMSAEDFKSWLLWVLIICFIIYEAKQEINTNRVKRFTRK